MLIPLIVSPIIREKLLSKHGVQVDEEEECFLNHMDHYLTDTREDHQTDPPTLWFVGETDRGRMLKIIVTIQRVRLRKNSYKTICCEKFLLALAAKQT